MIVSAVMSNSAPGVGTIVPGNVGITVALLQGPTVLVQRSFNAVARSVHVSNASAADTTSIIGGAPHGFRATLAAGTPFETPTTIVGFIRQGTAQRGAIVGHLSCGAGSADVLRNGSCTIAGTYAASNSAPGTGTLVPGNATLNVSMLGNIGEQDTLLTTSIPITLAAATPAPTATIGTVNVQGTPIIGVPGPTVPLSVQLVNPGTAIPNATVRIQVQQGAAARDAGGGTLAFNCGSGAGVIPTGGCTLNTHFAVSNATSGSGTFVAGAATLGIIINDPAAGQIRKFLTIQLTAR
jgi:hypothetical protein